MIPYVDQHDKSITEVEAAMSLNRPRVSIGVPVRNGERYLAEALDSLLSQSYSDFELIISDNASSDGTEAICRDYAARDPRVRYYRSREDVGLANNFNFLFIRARGKYFKWAAADDVHEPDWIARCLAVLDQDPTVVLVYARARFIDENGKPLGDVDPGFNLQSDLARERLRYVIHANSWVNAIFGMIRTEALAKTRLLPNYPGGDYPLLAELALEGKFVEVQESLFLRRLHPGASSQNVHDVEYMVRLWSASGHKTFPTWNRSKDNFMTIMHSRLSAGEKLSLSGSLLRVMVTARWTLFNELKAGLKA
jgi:glycosyltransferase involved in cell wall biosynthesis